jgi:hypothetical protein
MPRRKRTDRRWQARVSARREKRRGERTSARASAVAGQGGTAGQSANEIRLSCAAPDSGLDTPNNGGGASGVEITQHGEPPIVEEDVASRVHATFDAPDDQDKERDTPPSGLD